MNIKRRSWHTHTYLWWYEEKYGGSEQKKSVNLCPYVRVVLFHAPFRFFLCGWYDPWLTVGAWIVLIYGVPKLTGYFNYFLKDGLWKFEEIVAFIAIILGICWLIARFSASFDKKMKQYKTTYQEREEVKLMKLYIRSIHDRICPELTLEE